MYSLAFIIISSKTFVCSQRSRKKIKKAERNCEAICDIWQYFLESLHSVFYSWVLLTVTDARGVQTANNVNKAFQKLNPWSQVFILTYSTCLRKAGVLGQSMLWKDWFLSASPTGNASHRKTAATAKYTPSCGRATAFYRRYKSKTSRTMIKTLT